MGWLGRTLDRTAHWLLKWRIIRGPARWMINSRYAWSIVSRTDRVRARRLRTRVINGPLPAHISIIMDGNRRYAANTGLAATLGHRAGKEKLEDVMDWVLELGVKYLTVYALSTENINSRKPEELEALFDLYVEGLNDLSKDERILNNKVKVQVVGRKKLLPKRVLTAIENAETVTAEHDKFVFTICLAYGSREEIIEAVRGIAADHAEGNIDLHAINEAEISKRLWTGDLPDPDLVIRTSGEERISNFLLWQSAYAEYYFTDVYWPSFSQNDLLEAIEAYQQRKRRYGE
jgi:tritrans,polycis-undecaprenyl-diphosphate synthase [geranylgeranyl-diphosphate specific]